MKQIVKENSHVFNQSQQLIFIYSPFCRTCQLARDILRKVEKQTNAHLFYEMNAGLFPTFMQTNKIGSVPCVYIKFADNTIEKIYSISNIEKIAKTWSVFGFNKS
ncbi:thioredoxin [Paraliobacillus sp. JSM ZJ581]|uniref:thioredoxin n=1 Tax=Paraliobacillus sp. JSM ZJ581 TaxID=3342118 RepID=UPI0035A8F1E9